MKYIYSTKCMYKHMIPIMATVRKWLGKICLAFLFRVSLIHKATHGKILAKRFLCMRKERRRSDAQYRAGISAFHYANMSVQYTAIFHAYKNDYFQMKNCYIFLIFARKH